MCYNVLTFKSLESSLHCVDKLQTIITSNCPIFPWALSIICLVILSCPSNSVPTFLSIPLINDYHSERSTRQCTHIWSDNLQLACVQPPTSSYNLQLVYICTLGLSEIGAEGQKVQKSKLVTLFSCPGQLNKWHCRSVGLSVGLSEPTNNQSLGSIKEWP